ncbi:hypothetical protein [Micromonospora noduli]|uniref:Tc1-like transposase DDE domain-containing protein n=1 Tax=Micromonospora noduli TaxID=709876 RepID=A0A328N4K0_9ACTN|nr:hypothetical protein [Micromonospora noduli]RAO00783.1 hypothetical protein LAH08_03036 [Micromonospora noduli]
MKRRITRARVSRKGTVELVFLPTYSSWLNWIEAELGTVPYFA